MVIIKSMNDWFCLTMCTEPYQGIGNIWKRRHNLTNWKSWWNWFDIVNYYVLYLFTSEYFHCRDHVFLHGCALSSTFLDKPRTYDICDWVVLQRIIVWSWYVFDNSVIHRILYVWMVEVLDLGFSIKMFCMASSLTGEPKQSKFILQLHMNWSWVSICVKLYRK